jgi:2-methylisocitrate lyase-like PEP mutase family enzyme
MTTQHERAQVFASLHVGGDPVILFNIWDAGSAKAVQEIGAKAIATGSWSVAAAQGYTDGEKVPFEAVLANTERIVASVDLPVTIDFEGGYGESPAQLQANIARLIQAGAIGINFEDQIVGGEGLYPIEAQVARIRAIREAADRADVPLFINARTDIFLKLKPADHSDQHLEAALERAAAYAEAGANGFFAPGLRDAPRIKTLCEQSPLPVNHMMLPDGPSPKQLAALGVARISYAGAPYRVAMEAFKEAGRKALSLLE